MMTNIANMAIPAQARRDGGAQILGLLHSFI